ncbi:MAG: hypothetical protein MJZ53_06805 [Paludibacteraceae bacterium]|nr:hypothetical protein [Paludibacteraceae bacterium]
MKNYKNVEMFAKNAPTGSYAAGCPSYERGPWNVGMQSCVSCERTM